MPNVEFLRLAAKARIVKLEVFVMMTMTSIQPPVSHGDPIVQNSGKSK